MTVFACVIIIIIFVFAQSVKVTSCLFAQYTISLSSLCKLFWRYWTYKMPVRYILSSVWVRLSIFSQLSIIQYVGLCVFSSPIDLVMIEIIYILCLIIIIKSEVWTITDCLGLGHETMVCAVCLSIFLLLLLSSLLLSFFSLSLSALPLINIIVIISYCYIFWIHDRHMVLSIQCPNLPVALVWICIHWL